ncbi:hypothetical protein [Noviherbaspirillum sp. Root189]|uniref:hypothetical protein n=1 Tax=Noviherbaspirillum sp. Root189 TaxID=1736487 RepID=UPI0007108F68|nr:hypothetical protein [Noviherbaspirillum sp. Root189]KRB84825.1 hypothetical protein ASE07_22375 [Noviherbaspirillum sp. Root189]
MKKPIATSHSRIGFERDAGRFSSHEKSRREIKVKAEGDLTRFRPAALCRMQQHTLGNMERDLPCVNELGRLTEATRSKQGDGFLHDYLGFLIDAFNNHIRKKHLPDLIRCRP